MPFYAPKKYWDLYERDKIQIAGNRNRPENAPAELRGSGEFRSYHLAGLDENSEAFHRLMRHGYMASVSYVDKLIGDVLAELERLDLKDNTIVVLWGDHGWHLGEHNFWGKHNTMHLAMHVPLIVHVPGRKSGKTQALVETSDIFPTLCALTGVTSPDTVQGRSFAEIMEAPEKRFRDVVYSRFGPGDAVITDRFNYTRYKNGTSEMLYDHEKDPDENTNVAGDPVYAQTVKEMRNMLEARKAEAAGAQGAKQAAMPATEKAPGYEGDVPMPTHSADYLIERLSAGR
jgi:arylsulfatase A-like enzyme